MNTYRITSPNARAKKHSPCWKYHAATCTKDSTLIYVQSAEQLAEQMTAQSTVQAVVLCCRAMQVADLSDISAT
jgi:hypothetical protein